MPRSGARSNQPAVAVAEDHDYKAFRRFANASRDWIVTEGYERLYRDTQAAAPDATKIDDVLKAFETVPAFGTYAWLSRNVQQMKYGYPGWGIQAMTVAQAERLVPALEEAARGGVASGALRLDAEAPVPDYFEKTDFHQHPGGVSGGPLAGLEYELSRKTRTTARNYANQLYRSIFSYLPQDRPYDTVLDWGCSFGAGLITWMLDHPESQGHGIDIAAPCLKLAHARATEAGVKATWWQMDLERMTFADDTFDMAFFAFMLHELPKGRTPALLREARRVLKPGGHLIGMELVYVEDSPFQNAVVDVEAWLNNEPFMPDCYKTDYTAVGKAAGFGDVDVQRFRQMSDSVLPAETGMPPRHTWNIFRFTK